MRVTPVTAYRTLQDGYHPHCIPDPYRQDFYIRQDKLISAVMLTCRHHRHAVMTAAWIIMAVRQMISPGIIKKSDKGVYEKPVL